ncbi:nuclease-related domain-containing protein [Streptomyces sp. WG-D5]
MDSLKVVRWKRHGQDRLYVNLPDRTSVAWMDCRTGKIVITDERYRREALKALREYQSPTPPAPPRPRAPVTGRPKPLPPLDPANDLARNRPGARLIGMLAERGPTRGERLWSKIRRRPTDWDSWISGAEGERRVGEELKRLEPSGWRVLHGIELSNGADLDHLLIGRGGVFTVNAKNHEGKNVWIGDDMARVDHGTPRPYPRASRAEARRVREVLERYVDFPVPVEPMIVIAGTENVTKSPTQLTVRVYRAREVSALAPLTGTFTPDQAATLYEVARRRSVWWSD